MNVGFLRSAQLVLHIEMRRDESQMIGKLWILELAKRRRKAGHANTHKTGNTHRAPLEGAVRGHCIQSAINGPCGE